MRTQIKWKSGKHSSHFVPAPRTLTDSGQRLLDVAIQWRTLATATQMDALRPLFLNAARALELQAIDAVPRCSRCLRPMIAHLQACSSGLQVPPGKAPSKHAAMQ